LQDLEHGLLVSGQKDFIGAAFEAGGIDPVVVALGGRRNRNCVV
jgi:hypothetical protein